MPNDDFKQDHYLYFLDYPYNLCPREYVFIILVAYLFFKFLVRLIYNISVNSIYAFNSFKYFN